MLAQHLQVTVTAAIAAGSALLFVYWFRYTCLLILSAKTAFDYAAKTAAANQLGFLEVQARLREGVSADLDVLHEALERDYSRLTYLLQNASQAGAEDSSIEVRMLEMYYRLTGVWYSVSRTFAPEAARRALEDMSSVVAHLANVMGERVACGAAAA